MKKNTLKTLLHKKQTSEKIVMMTAYSARIAQIIDPHVDIILVGDSLGMTLHGLQSTLSVTKQMMISAAQSVDRGRNKAMMVVDLPFSTYEKSPEQAFETAAQIMQETAAEAVKLEGGSQMKSVISFLTQRQIPVMGHVGLLPQNVHHYGGYGPRGMSDIEAEKLLQDIKDVQEAGAFSVVIEGVYEKTALKMASSVDILTLGIGATASCDGQVLVSDDLFGITEKTARFVRKYLDLTTDLDRAVMAFCADVKQGNFPKKEELYLK